MSYHIDASLHGGQPRLVILDADSGAVRLAWDGPAGTAPAAPHPSEPEEAELAALKGLFRELFLLSCADRLGVGPAAGAARPETSIVAGRRRD